MLVVNQDGLWQVNLGAMADTKDFDKWLRKAARKNGQFATKEMFVVDGHVWNSLPTPVAPVDPTKPKPAENVTGKKVMVPVWAKDGDKLNEID